MSQFLQYFTAGELTPFQNKRPGELHVADTITLPNVTLPLKQTLADAKQRGVKFVILGIPEDIGPRANCGLGGATEGWQALINTLLNQQHNEFFDWRQCLLLGNVIVDDLQQKSSKQPVEVLRDLCQQLDVRVSEICKLVFDAGLQLIVIGGGHNNAFPIVKALSESTEQQVNCVNLDPHADFRPMEGRHSGNPFRYAFEHGFLARYWVLGLHQQKNNQETLKGLSDNQFHFTSYQDLFMTGKNWQESVSECGQYLAEGKLPAGIELDVDSIKNAAASAYSVAGFTLEEATYYVHQLATQPNQRYLHLCEAAPTQEQLRDSGQALTQLLYAYVIAH